MVVDACEKLSGDGVVEHAHVVGQVPHVPAVVLVAVPLPQLVHDRFRGDGIETQQTHQHVVASGHGPAVHTTFAAPRTDHVIVERAVQGHGCRVVYLAFVHSKKQ